jgi:hypothetical protein
LLAACSADDGFQTTRGDASTSEGPLTVTPNDESLAEAESTATDNSGRPTTDASGTGDLSTGSGVVSSDATGQTGDATTDDTTTGGIRTAPPFVDVTAAAGILYDQGHVASPPDCLVDAINPNLPGYFCSPERYAGGAAVTDIDGDGYLDVYVTSPHGSDFLFLNQADGTFEDVADAMGLATPLPTNGVAFGDVDGDGDQDLYLSAIGDTRHYLFINYDGFFVEEGQARGAAVETLHQHTGSTPVFADYDLDGDLDVYVGEWRTHAVGTHPSHARLLRNLGPSEPGFFEDVTDTAGVNVDDVYLGVNGLIDGTFVLSAGFADMDGDGWPELLLASDFAASRLFWNQANGTFLDGTVASGVGTDENGMGSAVADFDDDGDLDWFVTSIISDIKTGNRLYRYDGDRTFSDATDQAGVRDSGWGWGASFFDHDNDGDLDLAATNGWYATVALEDPMAVWTRDGFGVMHRQEEQLGLVDPGQGRALITFDYDNDGDLDLLVTHNADEPSLFRNDNADAGHWLRVRAPGATSNTDGIGARITIFLQGMIRLEEIGGTSHYLGHGPREAHFGLGDAETIDELRVRWPASGAEVVLLDVAADQVLVVSEPVQ